LFLCVPTPAQLCHAIGLMVSGFDLTAFGKIRKSSKKNRKKWCKKTANFSHYFSQQTIATKPFKNIALAA